MKRILSVLFLVAALGAQGQTGGYQLGDKAADFELKNVDNRMVSMKDYPDAKGFIVTFTCNTCPVSQAYEDRIQALHKTYAPKGYPVIAINPNDPVAQPGDSFEKMRSRAKEKGYEFPYLMDPGQTVTRRFGATRTPHVFIVQKASGGVVVRYIGAVDDDTENTSPDKTRYVEGALNALLSGRNPEPAFTKAVGCS
ncbi:MAG TPA: thioredoxin family protein, partial [Sphingobacteriaceae bacterium]